jgi:OmpR-family two-component system manganese-sensing sensor histidine kinase
VVEEQQAIATEKSLHLTLCLPVTTAKDQAPANYSNLYWVQGDRDQLSRLFTNLVSNAIQYTPISGTIEVTLQRIKLPGMSQLQVQVIDSGIGIPADALPHLFDRFYRVDPARSSTGNLRAPAASGSGLGLAIAKVIVENHQGQIQVESTPNQGTTVTVLLPYHRAEALKAIGG